MTKVRADITVMVVLMLVAMASCWDSKERMQSAVTLQPALATSVQTQVFTRAQISVNGTTPGSVYETSESLNGLSNGLTIRAYAVPTSTDAAIQIDDNRKAGSFRYSSNRWHSSVVAENTLAYNLYAFSPVTMPGASNQVFNWGLSTLNDNRTFSTANVALTFTNLDVITTTDPIFNIAAAGKHIFVDNGVEKEVVTEAQNGQPQVTQALTTPTLTKGNYSIGTVVMPSANDNLNMYKVWLAMDHIYSKATICFGVDADYNDVRTIRLKSAKIVLDKSQRALMGNHSYSFNTSSLVFAQNANWGQNVSQDLEIDLLRGTTANDNMDRDRESTALDYVTLTPPTGEVGEEVYREFAWFCFLPQSIMPKDNQGNYTLECPSVKLKVEYDIYDKEDTPNPVRLNQTAENTIELSSFYREDCIDHTPRPGDHIKLKVLVKPSYLYVLTDPDGELKLEIERRTE